MSDESQPAAQPHVSHAENNDDLKWLLLAAGAVFLLAKRGNNSGSSRSRSRNLPAAREPSPIPQEEWWIRTYDLALQAAEEYLPNAPAAMHRLLALSVSVLAAHETGQGQHEREHNPGHLIAATDASGRARWPGGEVYATFPDERTGVRAMVRLLATGGRYTPALRALFAPRSLIATAAVPEWAYSVAAAGYTEPTPRRTNFTQEIRTLTATAQRVLNVDDAQIQPSR